jgi:hypothetical protein
VNWQRELEARLADDARLERKKSRAGNGEGFFFREREVAHFPQPGSVTIRMSAAAVYALGALAAEECVLAVSKDGIVVRLQSEEDLQFAQKILARLFREKAGEKRPEGKSTNRSGSGKQRATKAFSDAEALKALRNLTNWPR